MQRNHRPRWFFLATILLTCLAAAVAAAQGQGASSAPADTSQTRVEVALEGAFAVPMADLAASFRNTERGFSAGTGYTLGMRVRWLVRPALAISPTFHFTKFGELEDYDAQEKRFHIATSVARYGLDMFYQTPGRFYAWRPFVGAGLELARNRYKETFDADGSTYSAAKNALGPRVLAGVRRGDFYASLCLRWSRFTTPRFFFTEENTRYAWDAAEFTIGYTLPRF